MFKSVKKDNSKWRINNMQCFTNNVLLFSACLVFTSCLDSALCLNNDNASPDFSHHTIIKPKFFHGREKREISSTREHDNTHAHDVSISYEIDDREMILDLKLNHDLVTKDYFEKIQKDGKHVINKPLYEDLDLCHYRGEIRGISDSWAAVSTCDGLLKGALYDGKDILYLHSTPLNKTTSYDHFDNGRHYIYNHQHLIRNFTCGYQNEFEKEHTHSHDTNDHEFNRILRYKRAISTPVRGPYKSNKQSRYVELLLVVDNKEFKALDSDTSKVYRHCKDIANIINSLYSPLNIFIALVGVVIWTENDEIFLVSDGDKTLTNFLHYRRERLVKDHPNDNAQLLTRVQFDGGVVGKALKGPICTYEYSGGVSMDHSEVVGLVATTMAHEMGHNFGMEHDTSECECPDERCIMAASSSTIIPNHWSSCSLEYLALAFEHGMEYCLRNKPTRLFGSPVCGNGYVEQGEQCDCGLAQRCDNPCCNPSTCLLHTNATCGTGDCCDLQTCQFKIAGTLCRSDDHECDLPEFCTGESEFCPADVFKRNTEVCDGGKAFCYQGSCRTRSDQCKLLWGPSGSSSGDECYKSNAKGNRNGNCGYNRLNQTFIKCHDEHIFCGMLQCKHLNERLEFGMESVAILSYNFLNVQGNIIPCRTAIVDLGLNQVDPGLTPDGAKCGVGKMCVNQKCMPVESLRVGTHRCHNDCNGNGICNSNGNCHCRAGFAPPYCDYPGPGGSEDSGPATDPNARRTFIISMYIIFLGIVPLIALCALLSFYYRQNPVLFKRKITSTKLSPIDKSPSKQNGIQRHLNRGNVIPFRATSPTSVSNSHSSQNGDDLNSSLLQSDTSKSDPGVNNNFFGHFKGFSLTPLGKTSEEVPPSYSGTAPINLNTDRRNIKNIALVHPTTKIQDSDKAPARTAPPVPQAPIIKNSSMGKSQIPPKPVQNKNTVHWDKTNDVNKNIGPALPPLNPGSHPRPLISEPILEASTCTAKELISPLKHSNSIPIRTAPEIPVSRPQSTGDVIENLPQVEYSTKKSGKDSSSNTLNRIASFLSKDKNKSVVPNATSTLNKPGKGNKNLDLRNLQISNPILQKDIVVPDGSVSIIGDSEDEAGGRITVTRAQSMRSPTSKSRPSIPSFGSMRQPGSKRPQSIAVNSRPTRPPPPRPDYKDENKMDVQQKMAELDKIAAASDYQVPIHRSESDDLYDDCIGESMAPLANISEELSPSSSDNIYAVIEESTPPKSKITSPINNKLLSPQSIKSPNSGSSESVGLLGEIVSEIQHRNFDSIYSTSTLGRKKREQELQNKKSDDAGAISDSDSSQATYANTGPDSEYSVMTTAASTTSSGYINPSVINAPFKNQEEPSNEVKSIKTALDAKASLTSFQKPIVNKTQNTAKPTRPIVNRSVTPPNLKTNIKPSTIKNVPSSPKNLPKSEVAPQRKDSFRGTKVSELKTNDSNNSNNKLPTNKGASTSKLVKQQPKITVKTNDKPSSAVPTEKPKVTPKPLNKPTVVSKPVIGKSISDAGRQSNKPISALTKTPSESSKQISTGVRLAAVKTSNVAALQQKFENSNS